MAQDSAHSAKYPIKSLEKALNILLFLSGDSVGAISADVHSLADISSALGLSKSSTHRLLDTLVEYNFVERDASSMYRLGWNAYRVGNAVAKTHSISSIDFSDVHRLCEESDETVTVSLRNGSSAIILYRVLPPSMRRMKSDLGYREYLHATALGKILLCEHSSSFIHELLGDGPLERFTPTTITELTELLQELQEVRKNQMATDMQEAEYGLNCIAVPIRDHTGEITASLSISIPVARFQPEHVEQVKHLLRETATDLSAHLGYQT